MMFSCFDKKLQILLLNEIGRKENKYFKTAANQFQDLSFFGEEIVIICHAHQRGRTKIYNVLVYNVVEKKSEHNIY